jgi:hypothetical protein
VSYLFPVLDFITATKYLGKSTERREKLFWLMISEV